MLRAGGQRRCKYWMRARFWRGATEEWVNSFAGRRALPPPPPTPSPPRRLLARRRAASNRRVGRRDASAAKGYENQFRSLVHERGISAYKGMYIIYTYINSAG